MKAKIKPRSDFENRTKLETVIPLSVPFVINIDPSDLCNFQCKFCPTANRKLMKTVPGRGHIMDFELYKKIIDDICEFEKPIKVLRLFKDGEPLMNPKFVEMIKYAKAKKCAERIDTTTNASLLTHEKSLAMIEAGIDRINISIEGVNNDQYFEFSKYKLDFDKLVENISFLYKNRKNCEIYIKICAEAISEADQKKFYDIFGNISDIIFVEHIISCWPGYELKDVKVNKGNGLYGQKLEKVEVCPYVFYAFSINSDGTVSNCTDDWSHTLIVGDTKKESVKDIWNGKKLFEYQKMFLEKKRKDHPFCKDCGQMSHGVVDNVDDYADMLLKKICQKK